MLKSISLQNFRSYEKQEFSFGNTTLIVGPNTSGKTNLIEGIYLLSNGKSFRTDKDIQMIRFGKEIGRVKARLQTPEPARQSPDGSIQMADGRSDGGQGIIEDNELEIVITNGLVNGKSQYKKFLVNGVAKRRVDFASNFSAVLFSPQDLDIIIDSPSLRRSFLDEVLEQTDRSYRVSLISYTKALRQRNALLELLREGKTLPAGRRELEYWDNLVIENGGIIILKREEFIKFANSQNKDIFDFTINYDKSVISRERLLQYEAQEVLAGVTLVGPHRDDFSVFMSNGKNTSHDVKYFGSRGQQRLVILQLKVLELLFIEKALGKRPTLILDDIFSELDSGHINLIFDQIGKQQTILTTTHEEFIPKKLLNKMKVLHFSKE
nr:AAA family ATPase [Candidatus Levybacteria bacterium]